MQDWHASMIKAEHEHAGQEILVRLAAASEKQRLAWAQFCENAIASKNAAFFDTIRDILAAQRRGYYYTDESQEMARRAVEAYDDFIDAELRRVAAKLKEKRSSDAKRSMTRSTKKCENLSRNTSRNAHSGTT
jgi:hypothetical protein